MTSPERVQGAEGQSRLVRHFQDQYVIKYIPCFYIQRRSPASNLHSEIGDHAIGWSNLWDTDNSDLWDRGQPSPALVDLIEQRRDLFCPLNMEGRTKKAFVPGCGKGYDVVMLALHGFDVYGLEVSATGIVHASKFAKAELATPQLYNFGQAWGTREQGRESRGEVTFIEGDFFQKDWEIGVQFDLIYDYTFLCALHPTVRPQWAARMADLLSPTGMLVCLEFPMYKDPKLPGPPWGLNGVHWNLLVEGGNGLISDGGDGRGKGRDRGQFQRMLYVKPARSYDSGRGTDMLSVYIKKL